MNKNHEFVAVWDVPVRLFHWLLVVCFAAAYFTAKYHIGLLHTLTGYTLCFLLLARVIWGVVGNKHARFNSFVFSSSETVTYLRSISQRTPILYYGHNPAGALMVFALLIILTLITLSGLSTLAVIDFEGPLLFLLKHMDDNASYFVYHLHSWLVNVALVMVALHLLGVTVATIYHQENLVRAMVTGRKKRSTRTIE